MIFQELQKLKPDHPLVAFIPKLKRKKGSNVAGIEGIEPIIKHLGDDTDWQRAVWKVYIDLYWKFVAEFSAKTGSCKKRPGPVLKLPVSRGFVLDTAINHGADLGSFQEVIKRMPEAHRTSSDEVEWLTAFATARHGMLKSGYEDLDTSKTGDRTRLWQQLVDEKNFELNRPIRAAGGYWGGQGHFVIT